MTPVRLRFSPAPGLLTPDEKRREQRFGTVAEQGWLKVPLGPGLDFSPAGADQERNSPWCNCGAKRGVPAHTFMIVVAEGRLMPDDDARERARHTPNICPTCGKWSLVQIEDFDFD